MIPSRVTVIGSGCSGIESARYCAACGASVLLSDFAPQEIVAERVAKAGLADQIRFEGGGHSDAIYNCDLVVVSPGVPLTAPLFAECERRSIKIIGEVELGFCESEAPFVAVTGSAGKSTTVSLIDSVLRSAGMDVALCGNIGTPVIEAAPRLKNNGVAVVEVSSFQLETIDTFKPEIAVILNLAPNHLDRHASLEEYYGAKYEIARNMKNGLVILNGTQQELLDFGSLQKDQNRVLFFGAVVDGFDSLVEENNCAVFVNRNGEREEYGSLASLQLCGEHNVLNALVAAAVAKEKGLTAEQFSMGLSQFDGLAHRMELTAEIDGVKYYNDSKATTPESMAVALRSFEEKSVVLIAGGKDKGGDFEAITSLVSDKCKKVILIGTAADHLASLWSDSVETETAEDLKTAVLAARDNSAAGETVLLSPGCASFDMFTGFADRGDQFKAIVKGLIHA